MNAASAHESRYWLAAGWTMFHFLWIGAVGWIAAAALRSILSRTVPRIRYSVALGLLLATAGVPCGLFVAGLGAVDEMGLATAGSEAGAPRQTAMSRPEAMPAESPTSRPAAKEPARRFDPAVRRAPFDWTAVPASGLGELFLLSCFWLPWLWLAGTPLALATLACGATSAERLRRGARLLEEGEVAAACRRLQAALLVGRRVAVAVCDRVAAPLLVGIVRPVILLPPAVLAGCSPDQIEMILIHELAHVRRWDNLVNLVQRLIEAVLFFHPVIWWLSSWVRLEREECCDSVVLAHTGPPQVYAETLAALALQGLEARHVAVAMTDSHLVVRIRHILKLEEEEMSVSRKTFLTSAGLLLFCGCVVIWYVARARHIATGVADKSPAGEVSTMHAGQFLMRQVSQAQSLKDDGTDTSEVANAPSHVKIWDILSIDQVNSIRTAGNVLRPGDELLIRAANVLPIDPSADPIANEFKQINGPFAVQPDGTVDLGPEYGSVAIEGLTIKAAKEALDTHLRKEIGLSNPKVAVSLPVVNVKKPVSGAHLIRPDGTVLLGEYGSIYVNGKTLDEVKAVVEKHLAKFIDQPEVKIAVVQLPAK